MPRFATFNMQAVGHEHEYERVAGNLHHLAGLLGPAGVVGLQEMYPPDFMRALDVMSGWAHTGTAGGPSSPAVLGGSPIAWAKEGWSLLDHGQHLLNDGEAGVSFARRIAWALLSRDGYTDRHVLVTSRHYVARAFAPDGSTRPRKARSEAAEQPHRQAMWSASNATDRTLLANLTTRFPHAAQVHMGDVNRAGGFHVWGHQLAGRKVHQYAHGLDRLAFIDGADLTWRLGESQVVRLASDHRALIVPATLHQLGA